MCRVLRIESAESGLLYVNGQFCGPLDREGQAFPAGEQAEIFIQLFPFGASRAPLSVRLDLEADGIARLEPKDCAYALLWPDGIIQLELRFPDTQGEARAADPVPAGALLRYLSLRLAGDAQADALLMRPQDGGAAPSLGEYIAALPLRFAPMHAGAKYDDRAGLLRRAAENVAFVDAALAVTVPAGQGRRLIERIEILRT